MIGVQISHCKDADRAIALPCYQTAGAAGMDLRANFAPQDRTGVLLQPLMRALIPMGFCIAIPTGYEAQIRPRSGLAHKHGVTLANAVGTIDSDYRGPIGVVLINLSADAVQINHGDRIAQMVFAPVLQVEWHVCDHLPDTVRGSGGFGSTGQQ